MRKRASVEAVGTALLAALGLLGGCGGGVAAADGDGGPNPNGGDAGQGDALGNGHDAPSDAPTTCALHPCLNPSPLLVANVDTGYDTCEGGTLRRRAVVDCPSLLLSRAGDACSEPDGGPDGGIYSECASDKDCTSHPNGYCGYEAFLVDAGSPGCYCSYGCLRDADCGSGNVCVCGDPVGYCVSAICSSDASCLPGCDCVARGAFVCQSPADTCISNGDCIGAPTTWSQYPDGLGSCAYTRTAVCAPQSYGEEFVTTSVPAGLTCQPGVACGTGRPFLVHGTERLAECVARGDWRAPSVAPNVQASSDAVRARLAAHWARVGLMEHASIAAFARFTLHLLAVGAPPDLVSLSQQAIGDETEHARLAFSLASAYAGRAMGPGALAIDGSLDGFDVVELVGTLLREGCIGETVAAIEARDALENVHDPVVRRVLETIARDELRHAELAWRTLAWLVSSGRVSRALVRNEVAAALREMKTSRRRSDTKEDLSAYGVVSDARHDELRHAAATRVIGRCAEALLGQDAQAGQRSVRATA
jgi:hypothetical protein